MSKKQGAEKEGTIAKAFHAVQDALKPAQDPAPLAPANDPSVAKQEKSSPKASGGGDKKHHKKFDKFKKGN